MDTSEKIVNKVAESGIITIDLAEYFPKNELAEFDLKNYLFKGLILKEQDFRTALKETDWTKYQGKNVAIFCSADAIIPQWAFMLVATYLQPMASYFIFGEKKMLEMFLLNQAISKIDVEHFKDQRVVIKGCGEKEIPVSAYIEITRLLRPVAKSIMYGEPCSTVPIFKRKDN